MWCIPVYQWDTVDGANPIARATCTSVHSKSRSARNTVGQGRRHCARSMPNCTTSSMISFISILPIYYRRSGGIPAIYTPYLAGRCHLGEKTPGIADLVGKTVVYSAPPAMVVHCGMGHPVPCKLRRLPAVHSGGVLPSTDGIMAVWRRSPGAGHRWGHPGGWNRVVMPRPGTVEDVHRRPSGPP